MEDKNRSKKKIKKSVGVIFFILFLFSISFVWVWNVWNKVPSNIHVRAGEDQGLEFYVPATATIYKNEEQGQVNVNLNQPLTFYGETEDTYTMDVDLFGFIPFKQSEVSVIQEKRVIPLGFPVGIYVQSDGVLVVDTGEFTSNKGKKVSPTEEILSAGDYIVSINQKQIYSKEVLMDEIALCEGKNIQLGIRRADSLFTVNIKPVKNQEGEYKLGIWVRDNAQGIGTLTFVDENGYFGALGHGINDVDTTNLMEIRDGALYKADIISITKGSRGKPGELSGVIAYATKYKMGEIVQNTKKGVYGILDAEDMGLNQTSIPIALKQEIKKGKAQILCTFAEGAKEFDVEITAIHQENDNINRGLELKVTDETLLQTTGGIVQGMSGSPIIQDGKIVGAVTHVLVNDPTRGYGIFIENMLEAAE